MCGIAFLHNPSLEQEQLKQQMSRAVDALQHRGPDENCIWQRKGTVVGHCRLSIIDLSGSRQPMTDPKNRFVLSYNGEIYNYREIRKQLSGRWNFITKGDTEVLLAGLLVEGTEILNKLEGMWAFALWDCEQNTILLSRDRIGKKPLYYIARNKAFICASELPALNLLDNESWSEDFDSTADYFRYGFYLPGFTAYSNVREVLPGHYMIWQPERETQQSAYWNIKKGVNKDKGKASLNVSEAVYDAVKKRKVADVEIGAFLSGGIDSSLVCSLLKKSGLSKFKTFTIGFTDQTYDESKYAKIISELYKTDHYYEIFDDIEKDKIIKLLSQHVGQPFCDSSILPTKLVSEIAASHVKVALSGDGGDELFCGYERYRARVLLKWYDRLPDFFKNNVSKLLNSVPETTSHHSRSLLKKAILFNRIYNGIETEKPYLAPLLFDSREHLDLVGRDIASCGHIPPNIPEETMPGDIGRMMYADCLIYLPQDILLKVDRASMACSLETRAPFLDHHVIEKAFEIPWEWQVGLSGGKKILRKSFWKELPKWVWKRRKQGFAVPVHKWFKGNLGNELKELIRECNTGLNAERILEYLNMHQSGKKDFGHHLWAIYIYYLWKSNKMAISLKND